MNYNEAVAYILNIPKFTEKNGLEHTKIFLERLGNPQKNKKILHVAGTNGKGSVCCYIQALLQAEDKSVGLFTSPHLVKMNERIHINERDISDERFVEVFQYTKRIIDQMCKDGLSHPTFFEFLFGMAMVAFHDSNVEYIVLETGLGGRLDATNAIEDPLVTIITSISMDHMDILGDSIEKIACEKAGILKPQVPVVFDGNEEISRQVIIKKARKMGLNYTEITKKNYKIKEINGKYIAFSSTNAYYEDTLWCLANIGCYQIDNAMLALETMRLLHKNSNQQLSKWKQALYKVHWAGRMEEIKPGVYIDGAHNIGAIIKFVESIQNMSPVTKGKQVLLFSAVQEKDYEKMIAYLCNHMRLDEVIITTIADSRGEKAEKLATIFQSYTDCTIIIEHTLKTAWKRANRDKGTEGRLYCLGSLYLVGMIKELITGGN